MSSKFVLGISFIILLNLNATAQQEEYAYNAGAEIGVLGFMGKQNAPDMIGLYQSFTTAYYSDLRNGIRTGLTYSSELENCNNAFLVPIYFAHRSKPSVNKNPIVVESIGDLFAGILSAIIPNRIEYNIGPTIGYLQSSNSPILDEEYRVRREMLISINAGIRPSFQIWRFNLGVNLNVGYVPTKNFRYYSANTLYNGTTSNWMVQIGGFLTYSFDL